jgi:hypothetical protein
VRPRTALLAFLLAMAVAPELGAQQGICDDTDTLDDCNGKVADRIESTAADPTVGTEASLEDAKADLAAKPAGTTALGPGLGSAINDFIPVLAGALGFSPTTTEEGAAAFESNVRIPVGSASQKVRMRVVLREAEIYEPLRLALPEATREERTAALSDQLGDFDDVGLNLAWNYESQSFGRSFEAHRSQYDRLLGLESEEFHHRPGVVEAKRRVRHEADSIYRVVRESITADSLDPARGCTFVPIRVAQLQLGCFKRSVRDRLEEAIERAMRATVEVEAEFDGQLERTGFYDLPNLVNNQPQLAAQVNVDVRQELVGPNVVTGTVRYETGFINMNGLRRACRQDGQTAITVDCLRGYAKDPARQASLKRGDRFFVALSYGRRSDYAVALEEDGVTLDLDGTWSFSGELGFGRYVAFNRTGDQIGRIDLSALYLHHQDDPNRQNRFVGSATYTQRIAPSLSLAAGVSYASAPEFLGEVEHEVSATFGLRYKLIED